MTYYNYWDISDTSEVRARAVLCPLTLKGHPVSMPYRTLNIGTGMRANGVFHDSYLCLLFCRCVFV